MFDRYMHAAEKMASKSSHNLLDSFGENRPMEAIGRSSSSNSLTGESSSASRVIMNGMFVGGVRGMSGAIKMERSEHERAKYPDRINLDRKGLHGKEASSSTIFSLFLIGFDSQASLY